jgi:hypothetical protein
MVNLGGIVARKRRFRAIALCRRCSQSHKPAPRKHAAKYRREPSGIRPCAKARDAYKGASFSQDTYEPRSLSWTGREKAKCPPYEMRLK